MRALYAAGLALLFGTLASCGKTQVRSPTAVVVAIEAESMVRAAIDSVRVEIASGPSRDELDTTAQELFDLRDDARWPLTLTLLPKTQGTNVFRIWVRAQHDGRDVSEVRVISGFAPSRVLLLEVLLPDECIGFLGCTDEQTCAVDEQGVVLCDDADVPVAALVPFTKKESDRLRGQSDAGEPEDASAPEDGGEPLPDAGEPLPDGGEPPPPDAGPTQERCDNGDDDDGDGDVDCADDDCNAGFECVPDGDELAIMLTDVDEACPAGFGESAEVSSDLSFMQRCSGCSCTIEQGSGCTAPIYFFDSVDACNAAGADSAGILVVNATATCPQPVGEDNGVASPFGWRVGNITTITPARCAPSGTARLDEPQWRRTRKLCRATGNLRSGGGCDDGYLCMPRVETETGSRCALMAAGEACLGGSGQDWYEGFSDGRRCASCGCDVQGGTCDGATARLGSDYECDAFSAHTAGEGERQCFESSVYYPPADLLGEPSTASCSTSSSTIGTVELLGGQRVCCDP